MATKEVKLLGAPLCPYVLRIRWALKIKGVEYEFIEEDTSNKSPLLLKYNPIHKKVPVLVHDGKPLAESLVIMEYIDEIWKDYPLLPKDPLERANARFLANFIDQKCISLLWLPFITQGKEHEDAVASAIENLTVLERELNGNKFFGGDTIGFVDISLGWMTFMISMLENTIQLKLVDEQRFPSLCAWIRNFLEFPTLRDCFPPHDDMLAKYRSRRDQILASKEAT